MVSRFRTRREKEYPLPHNMYCGVTMNIEPATVKSYFNYPLIIQDEARIPGSFKTNPEHTAFAEYVGPNCCADSEVMSIYTEIRFTMAKALLTTDGVHAVRVCFLPINSAFEDLDAVDELTSVTVGDVLEMLKETTDRQSAPLFNNVKQDVKFTGSATYGADVPGMDTSQIAESVVFDPALFYDAINYYTISGKLRSVTKGLRWITLTRARPTRSVLIRQTGKTKRMNPYTQNSVIIGLPKVGTQYQIPIAGETSSGNHLIVDITTRYLEWNDMFGSERVTPA